jgi:hypothetical protein
MLAREALGARGEDTDHDRATRRIGLTRFFAENVVVQSSALERNVIDGAEAINTTTDLFT